MTIKIYIFAILGFLSLAFNSNTQKVIPQNDLEGQVYKIKVPQSRNFEHLEIPKDRFVRKKGGTPSLKTLHGIKVRVKEHNPENGKSKLERLDGKKFYNVLPVIYADIEAAASAGELEEQS